ncbi:armadillo-type protein [Obelidium mucronatum]|nr:armadillo-type protein [Obelidium mucronatum]
MDNDDDVPVDDSGSQLLGLEWPQFMLADPPLALVRQKLHAGVPGGEQQLAVLVRLVDASDAGDAGVARACAKTLLASDDGGRSGKALAALVGRRAKTATSSTTTTAYALLKWTALLLEHAPASPAELRPLLLLHAALLDQLCRAGSTANPDAAAAKTRRVRVQAVKATRRFMLLGKPAAKAAAVLAALLSDNAIVDGTDPNAQKYAILIGEAAGCFVHKAWDLAPVDAVKDKIAKYYEKNVLGGAAKGAVSNTVLSSFNLFFKQFLTIEMLQSQLCSSAERLMLRSPEFVIRIFTALISPVDFDVGKLFREKFADSLLTHMKSTNENIRTDAALLFKSFCEKSVAVDEIAKVADIVLKAFTAKTPTPEAKILYYNSLSVLRSPSAALSSKIITALIPLSQKETTEAGIQACFAALSTHIESYLETSDSAIITNIVSFITTGLTDAKSTNIIPEKSIIGIVEGCLKAVDKVQAAGNAMIVDTGAKKENPVLVEGYLAFNWVVRFSLWETSETGKSVGVSKLLETKKTLSTYLSQPHPKSFLLNEKFYPKLLISAQDQSAFFETLSMIISTPSLYALLPNKTRAEKIPFGSAWCHLMVNPIINHTVRRATLEFIQAQVSNSSSAEDTLLLITEVGRTGLGSLLEKSGTVSERPNPSILTTIPATISAAAESSSAWGDDAQKQAHEFSTRVFNSIQSMIPNASIATETAGAAAASILKSEALTATLMNLLVLCTHPVVAATVGSDAWIRVCWRAGIDPLEVVAARGSQVVLEWMNSSNQISDSAVHDSQQDPTLGGFHAHFPVGFKQSTLNAIQLLVGIYPDLVMNACMPVVLGSLDNKLVESVSLVDVAVWQGVEGVAVCDLFGKLKVVKDGNGDDDQDDLRGKTAEEKWEIQLKKELQAKKGASAGAAAKPAAAAGKGATAAGDKGKPLNAKAAAAAKAEKEAEKLQLEKESVNRKRVQKIRDQVSTALDILEAILKGVAGSLDDEAREAFEMWMARCIEAVLKVVERESVVVRRGKRGKKGPCFGIPEDLCKKDLSVVLTKLLMAAKGDYVASNPLSPGAFSFIFPLIQTLVLRAGRTRNMKEKIRTELIIFAAEILIAHCGLGWKPVGSTKSNEDVDPEEELSEAEKLVKEMVAVDEVEITNELLNALLSQEPMARQSALKALQHLAPPESATDGVAAARVWMAKFDSDEDISGEASRVWEMWNDEDSLRQSGIQGIVDLVCAPVSEIRAAAGRALNAALEELPDETEDVLKKLYATYEIKNIVPVPEYDDFGIVIPESLDKKDEWPARSGIALALQACASVLDNEVLLNSLFDFLINQEALGDREESVRLQMLEAGIAAVNTDTGKSLVNSLLKTFTSYLSQPAGTSETHDLIRESAVILLGTVAQHLDASDRKIPEVMDRLVETLKTPSEVVQMAVAECMPPLIKIMSSDEVRGIVERLLRLLYASPKYAERRGAAYGIAGAVKGRGISSLKEYGIMASLKDAIEDKKKMEKREGALFAFETLSTTLGRLFEPYVIQILPLLLVCYGDNQRELVMPSILNGLEDKAWRTKTGSIEMLGAMAALAPKQLSLSLPTIIPRLCEVLADTHIKVQEAAKSALDAFGSVIKNPEIQELVPELLAALVDPNENTQAALTALLETSFVHYIDSPSLALIVPILQRGLIERVTETKKKAAQIMGQMATLTDQKDLIPYLDTLLPGLKEVLVDPVPDARAIAARGLGSMFSKLGESNFPDLIAELLVTLKSETSAVDRAGAAQGLSEVLAGAGIQRLESLLPEILNCSMSPRTYVREGFITLLVFLPATFGDGFQPYIGSIITPILRGLADETDTVLDLLLPELEIGLFDENWRIRQSSVQLMGDLLYRIAGVSGKLGQERYDSVLSALYMVRSDNNGIVRSASLHVWKSIVNNTPRTLKEILPIIIQMVIESLADPNSEKRGVAARTLGDLVRKLGDVVLEKLVPVLEAGLESEDATTREGASSRRRFWIRNRKVREAAAQAFDMLHQHMGAKAIDEVLPSLLNELKAGGGAGGAYALEALKEIMSVRSNVVFPVLIPTLLTTPITAFNARALASLISVAGSALNRRLGTILPVLMDALEQNDHAVPDIREAIKVLLLSVDEDGLYILMPILSESLYEFTAARARSACECFAVFCEGTKVDVSEFSIEWFNKLIDMFQGPPKFGTEMVQAAWGAVDALAKRVKKDEMERFVTPD